MGWNPGEAARRKVDEALERLAADLRVGKSERLVAYLKAVGRFRDYSWDNVLLISTARPDATHVAGHHGWQALRRTVKSGEKALLIFAAPDRDVFRGTGSRTTYVFDVSQTQGPAFRGPVAPNGPTIDPEHLTLAVASPDIRKLGVLAAVAYVAAQAVGIGTAEYDGSDLAAFAMDKTALATRLAAIQGAVAKLPHGRQPDRKPDGNDLSGRRGARLDENSFGRLHREYKDRLIHSILGQVRNRDKAEEIVARAFALAWEKRDSFRGASSASTWVEAIARNEVRQLCREGARHIESLDGENGIDPAVPDRVMDDIEENQEHERLRGVLRQLPDKQRRVLTAYCLEELSVKDIAHRDHLPIGTVLSRMHSGRQRLRVKTDSISAAPRSLTNRPAQALRRRSRFPERC